MTLKKNIQKLKRHTWAVCIKLDHALGYVIRTKKASPMESTHSNREVVPIWTRQ